MAQDKNDNKEQFYKFDLSIFRAIKATARNKDTGEIIEVALDSDHKNVYLYFVNTQEHCEKKRMPFYYSIDHMADFCGLNRQKFMKRKDDLEKLMLIETHRRGNGRKNTYTVNTLDAVELVWADGKLAPSRQRDYEKQKNRNSRVSRPSNVDTPSQDDSGGKNKEEKVREQRNEEEKTIPKTKALDFNKFVGAPQQAKIGNDYLEEKNDFCSTTSEARNPSDIPADWLGWNETISIEAMYLDNTPITGDGNITSAGLKILKKYGIDPATEEAYWFCRELLDTALLGGNSFTQAQAA